MPEELKPCPACESKVVNVEKMAPKVFAVYCHNKNCEMRGPKRTSRGKALMVWNNLPRVSCIKTQQLEEALENLLRFAECQICRHESTHRGGVIWTICDDCGAKWADDEGGKPKFKEPKEIVNARKALAAIHKTGGNNV